MSNLTTLIANVREITQNELPAINSPFDGGEYIGCVVHEDNKYAVIHQWTNTNDDYSEWHVPPPPIEYFVFLVQMGTTDGMEKDFRLLKVVD